MTPEELAARGLRVKPLVWTGSFDDAPYYMQTTTAIYRIYDFGHQLPNGRFRVVTPGRPKIGMFRTIELAQAAAEADHVARVAAMVEEIEFGLISQGDTLK